MAAHSVEFRVPVPGARGDRSSEREGFTLRGTSGRSNRRRYGWCMTGRWRRRLDPRCPYRAERAQGADPWLSASVAAAWQLLVPSFVALLVIRGVTSAGPAAWWLLVPSIASAIAGAWCAFVASLERRRVSMLGSLDCARPGALGPGVRRRLRTERRRAAESLAPYTRSAANPVVRRAIAL